MIGSELIVFFASFILRAVQQHMQGAQEARRAEIELMLGKARIQKETQEGIFKMMLSSPVFTFTQSVLAFITVILVIGAPVAAAFYGIPVYFAWEGTTAASSFLGLFSKSAVTAMKFQSLPGLAILPMHTHLMAAIAGLYFGGVKRK